MIVGVLLGDDEFCSFFGLKSFLRMMFHNDPASRHDENLEAPQTQKP